MAKVQPTGSAPSRAALVTPDTAHAPGPHGHWLLGSLCRAQGWTAGSSKPWVLTVAHSPTLTSRAAEQRRRPCLAGALSLGKGEGKSWAIS